MIAKSVLSSTGILVSFKSVATNLAKINRVIFIFEKLITLVFTVVSGQCPPVEEYSPCICRDDIFDDGALLLNCDSRNLDDQTASDLLDSFLAHQGDGQPVIRALRMEYNFLTKIPEQIKLFSELQELYLYENDIETISTGSLTFNAAEKIVGLGTKIKTIEPGAFVGKFYKTYKLNYH